MPRVRQNGKLVRTYSIWSNMRQRCCNPKNSAYKNYGGRGITVDANWQTYEGFYEDMGEAPEGMTLERRDNGLGYSKSNCYWADRFQQSNNRRNNLNLTYQGRTQTAKQWARELGIAYETVRSRIKAGKPVELILETRDQRFLNHDG